MPAKELHEMFIEEYEDNTDEDQEDSTAEQPGDLSLHTMGQMPVTVEKGSPDTASRHRCTLTDPNTGAPCNANFSRAGSVHTLAEHAHFKDCY